MSKTEEAPSAPAVVHRGDVLFTLGMEIQLAANDLRALTEFRNRVDSVTANVVLGGDAPDPLRGAGRWAAALRAALGLPPVDVAECPAPEVKPEVKPGLHVYAAVKRRPVVGDVVMLRREDADSIEVTVEAVDHYGRITVAWFVGDELRRELDLSPSAWSFR